MVGPVPNELKHLTWMEEMLIARTHVCRLASGTQSSILFQNQRPYHPTSVGHHALPQRPSEDAYLIARCDPGPMDWKIKPRPRPAPFTVHSSQGCCL
jgi:hypothetical protein